MYCLYMLAFASVYTNDLCLCIYSSCMCSLIPKMALPLDLRPLRRDAEDRDVDGADANGAATAGGLDYPAGAAFNAVRKNSNGNILY